MATLQFQIHTDKENSISNGAKMGAGKGFQAHKTPRRALGSVNGVGARGSTVLDLKSGTSAPAPKAKNGLASKDSKLKQQHADKENLSRKGKQQESKTARSCAPPTQAPAFYCLPDIEYMPPPSPTRDEDDDIVPRKERASTYVSKLLSWRPQCLLAPHSDSDEEEEEERRQRVMEELDNLPMLNDDLLPAANLHLSCENLDLDSLELPSMEDVLLPFIDDDPILWSCDSAHASLAQLELSTDSAGADNDKSL